MSELSARSLHVPVPRECGTPLAQASYLATVAQRVSHRMAPAKARLCARVNSDLPYGVVGR